MDARASEFGSAEAKARFSELLARVEAGETITIRRHGHAVAKLVPAAPLLTPEERLARIEAFIARRKERGPRLPPGVSVKDLINEGRRF